MLPITDPSAEQFLNTLSLIQRRLDTAQRQIASGLRVNTPSDAPDEVAAILQLHANIQQNQEIGQGLERAGIEASAGEGALSNAVTLLERAAVIATQATGMHHTAESRANLAQETQAILEQLVTISRTVVNGRYIFSGDLDQTPAYQVNPSSGTGVDRLQSAQATRQVATSNGTQFPVARSANDIFDARTSTGAVAPENVFAALTGLRWALLNNDPDAIKTYTSGIRTASTYLNTQLSFYGQVQNRIAAAIEDGHAAALRLTTELASRRDADTVAAIQELTSGQTQLQAALAARARAPRGSLFELL